MGFTNQVKVTAKLLNCRLQPSMDAKILNVIKMDEVHNVVAEQNGWGQLENGSWINLKFTVPVENQEKSAEVFVTGMTVGEVGASNEEVASKAVVAEDVTTFAVGEMKAKSRLHKVKKRESLWDIAELYFGDGARYLEIKEYNNLKSDILRSGMVLRIPNE